MKRVIKYISSLLIVILFVTGCAQNGGKSKVTKGVYVEKEIELPNAEGELGMNKSYNGKLLYATYNEGEKNVVIYNLKEDDTWEELNKFPFTFPEEKDIKSIGVSEDSIYLLVCSEDGKAEMSEYLKDGTTYTISLTEEGEDYLLGDHWYQLGKAENGDYLIQEDWGGNLNSFDGQTGALKYNLSKETLSFNVMGNKVIYNSGWQTRTISVCSMENGEVLESVLYEIKDNTNCVDLSEQGMYLFNAAGINFKGNNEEKWKNIVKAERNQLADSSKGIMGAWTLDTESFLVSFNGGSLKKYDYDPEAEDVVNIELTVAMGWENPLFKKAISIYQQEHNDVQINIVYYYDEEKGVDTLNAQLLAGEGPDILIFDNLPIQTYIDKGILVDLSDIASECCKKEGCYKNIIEAYKQKEGVWAIPMRFQVPMIWGKNEIIKKAQSIDELAQYKEAHPDEVLIKKNMDELAFQLIHISEPMLMDENKEYNRDKTKQYINALQTIGVQEGEITDEIYGERLEVEPSKYKELLDFANGESNIFFLAPRNVGDIAGADGILDARKNEDLGIAPLKMNGEIVFRANGIMGINFNKNQYEMAMQFYPICAPLLKDEKGIVSLDKVKRYLECLEIVSEDKESIKTQSECISMESPKYSELLDYVEGKANTFILAPRNILDIAKAAAILKAREEKGDVVPLEVNGQIVYILSGIMGINSNSKHQDIVKEVITIALGKGVQEEASYEGLSLNERDVNRQGYFAKGIAGTTIQDDTGRSVKIDSEAEEIYNKCKAYWKEASLYCDKRDKSSTELIKKVVIPSIESGKPTSSYLKEFETVINLQNEEQGTIESK